MRNRNIESDLAQELYERISELWVIDAHEHLAAEVERLAVPMDAVSLFENYPMQDLKTAGMTDAEFLTMIDREVPLEQRWEIFKDYLPLIRNTSYTRATLLGVRELYGFEDITADNYRELSEAMQAANKPGIYRRAFRDHARVVVALNQFWCARLWKKVPEPGSFCIPQMWEPRFNVAFGTEPLQFIETELGRSVSALDEYVDALGELICDYQRNGIVGIKLQKTTIQSSPQASEVRPLFDRVVRFGGTVPAGEEPASSYDCWKSACAMPRSARSVRPTELLLTAGEQTALRDYIAHAIIRIAGELGLVIIHHCGNTGLWGDFRVTDPTNLIPVFMRYPDVRFELYHSGIPWVRETGMIAKAFPNVWLNMCWGHSQCRQMARSALDEWLDLVPANKIIAFGGDTILWVEWVLGDLIQTRENIAAVLAKRTREGLLNEEQALDLARMMLYDNPRNLYQLECQPSDDIEYR